MSDKPKKPLIPWTKPKRKTHDEVFAELVSDLCDRGNKGLTKPITLGAKRSLQDLEAVYHQRALQSFKSHYGYNYCARPTNAAPNTNLVASFDGFFRVKDTYKPPMEPSAPSTIPSGTKFESNSGGSGVTVLASNHPVPLVPDTSKTPTEIKGDLEHRLSSLPVWCKDEATTDLGKEVSRVLTHPQGGAPNMWMEHSLSVVYEVSENRYENNVHADLLFISIHGSRNDGNVTAELVGFYCICVYYYTLSSATLAKQSLWASLCDRANVLVDHPLPITQPPKPEELTRILNIYGPRQFSNPNVFGIDFTSTPEESVEFLGRCQELFIYEDDKLSELKDQLDTRIFTPTQLPEWTGARQEIIDQTMYLANDTVQNNGDWKSVKFDRTYLPKVTSELTVAVKANFVHCILVSSQFPDISYRCVNISGLFYKVTGAKDTISGDFIKTLYSSARSLIPDNQIPAPDAPTKDDLDALLFAAREFQFEKKFEFKFDGENTHPPDALDGALFAAKGSFEADKTTDAALLVDTSIIKAFNFPEWSDQALLRELIRKDLVLKVQTALEQDPFAIGTNQWIISELSQVYSYASDEDAILCVKLILVYCNGSMSQINQKMSINKTFGYFAGVYYNQEASGW